VVTCSHILIRTTLFVNSGVIVPNCFHSCPLLVVHTSCVLLRWTVSCFLCLFLWCVLLWWCCSSRSYSTMWGVYLSYKNYTTPDDESIDLKHVEKCDECKHLGTRIKIVVHI
jgi:hypothetical protein